ncbi:MAG: glycoside hydrolase family 88 protein [Spirochaetes bacterium]|nr:glycoside hydrolase family 88 protein [Spirochaetota bacterium]
MNRDLLDILNRIIDQTFKFAFKYSEDDYKKNDKNINRWYNWDWCMGVAFYGIFKANKYLNNNDYIKLMKKWIDFRIKDKIQTLCINTCALMTSVLKLNELYKDYNYEKLSVDFDEYLFKTAPRVFNKAYVHTVINKIFLGKVWADTLFMACIYLAEKGRYQNKHIYYNESINQLYNHMKCLLDSDTNLFYHCWNDLQKVHEGVIWGRGNAWILISTIEILELINVDFPEKEEIKEIIRNFIRSLVEFQDKSGLWHTVINNKDTYLETSSSAGFAYGLLKGIRLGLFDSNLKEAGIKAIRAIIKNIDKEGNVLYGSSGTAVKESVEEYNKIPYEITPFTQGLTILALTEFVFYE